jgi:hypothetical protein
MTLSTLIRRISDDQHINVTWTDKAGNDYTVYDGDAETLKRRVPDSDDIRVLEMNVTDGALWIGLHFPSNSSTGWIIEQILANV